MTMQKIGILLLNTGSPDSPEVPAVRRYLRQFLSDPRVIDIAPIARWALLNFVILPFRPRKSAHAYQQIWTDRGSPLIVHSEDLRDALAAALPDTKVAIGMAYGTPSIEEGMTELLKQGIDRLVLVPMFPQYASATTGAVLEVAYTVAAQLPNVPSISTVPPFYNDSGYLDAWVEVIKPQLEGFEPDHVLMSFHGLPERHIRQCDPTGSHCLGHADCCDAYLDHNPQCYRAHCLTTGRKLAEGLGLSASDYTLAFQSKLGRDPWLQPAADKTVIALAKSGVKRLAIMSPAFVADCLETLEELGLRAKDDFLANGGEEFLLVTSLNSHPQWVKAMANLIRQR